MSSLSPAQIPFSVESVYKARVLFAEFATHKVGSMPVPSHAKFSKSAQWSRFWSCPWFT